MNLEHLRKQAKRLLRGLPARDPQALERYHEALSRPAPDSPILADAQHLIAVEYGFASWPKLKAHVDVLRLLMERSPDELKLGLACELGDETQFRKLLASRPDLARTLDDDDRRKLASAAESNNTNAVRLMLAAGWPLEVRGANGGTPLHWASWHGNVEMVREILRLQRDVDVTGDEYDQTPLGWAIHGSENSWHREKGDYAGVVEALLRAGAKAPAVTDDREQPIDRSPRAGPS
jgi:ankyrin repeat protein